ncbi:hypothetical protein CDAR_263251 [Caerostris darwini]|uniref:Uncharacterized protein n=1 Tax=Caerostris darwini TaxID=1538125 RepID=A0AAV4RXM0_9ARAC|nr:hypothetical protein CDAR_263251 [Caerostris darwini]
MGREGGLLSLTRLYRTLLWEMDHTGGDQRMEPGPKSAVPHYWTLQQQPPNLKQGSCSCLGNAEPTPLPSHKGERTSMSVIGGPFRH